MACACWPLVGRNGERDLSRVRMPGGVMVGTTARRDGRTSGGDGGATTEREEAAGTRAAIAEAPGGDRVRVKLQSGEVVAFPVKALEVGSHFVINILSGDGALP